MIWLNNGITLNESLVTSAEAGDLKSIQTLISDGAHINWQDSRGRTPIMAATHANQVASVEQLIDAGADIDLQDNMKDNPFLYAGAEGLLEILRLMIKAGADTKLTNLYGGSALIPACERGHVEVVDEILRTSDVDVNHINNLGWTALLEAIVLTDGGPKFQRVTQMLIDHGADISIPDKEGVTALEHAKNRGFKEIVSILERGS